MTVLECAVIGIGLAMDAAAVSICKGLASGKTTWKHSAIAGGYFGIFQALMPAIGFALGSTFARFIDTYDHWVAFVLLLLIGGNMLRESFGTEEGNTDASFGFPAMFPLAIATSIDALAVGVTFSLSFSHWREVVLPIILIGAITFVISAVAVKLGSLFGNKYQKPAERLGGVILILIGLKILLSGIGILSF